MSPPQRDEAALGWLLAQYRFDRYRRRQAPCRDGAWHPKAVDAARLLAMAAGECLTRDLINTPASDMGPEELEAAFLALANAWCDDAGDPGRRSA